jgi:hypothetical protein
MVLAARPRGPVVPDNFRLETVARARPGRRPGAGPQSLPVAGPVHARPHERGQSYAASQALDETMIGGTVGQVLASRNPHYQAASSSAACWAGPRWACPTACCCASSTPPAFRCPPILAWSACPAWRPGMAFTRSCSRSRRHRRGVGRQRRGRQRGRPTGALARLPRGRHRRRAGKMRVMSSTSSASTPASITRPAIWRPTWLPPRRTASTPSLKTSAAPAWMRPWRACNAFARIALCGMIAGYNGDEVPIKNARLLLTRRLLCAASSSPSIWNSGSRACRNWPAGRRRQDHLPRIGGGRPGRRTGRIHRPAARA